MKKVVTLILFFLMQITSGQSQKPLQISHLTGDFYVYKTFNIYKSKLISANAMYLVTDEGVVMFDCPWDEKQFQPLLDSIKTKHNKNVIMYFATHSHDDRAGGLDFYKQRGIKTYTIGLTDKILKRNKKKRAEFIISNDTVFSVGDYKFRIFYPGKGHTSDNVVIWFDKEKILYGGCFVKSTTVSDLGFLGEADVKEWEKSIKRVQDKFELPQYVIPGHEDWGNIESLDYTLKMVQEYVKSSLKK